MFSRLQDTGEQICNLVPGILSYKSTTSWKRKSIASHGFWIKIQIYQMEINNCYAHNFQWWSYIKKVPYYGLISTDSSNFSILKCTHIFDSIDSIFFFVTSKKLYLLHAPKLERFTVDHHTRKVIYNEHIKFELNRKHRLNINALLIIWLRWWGQWLIHTKFGLNWMHRLNARSL